MSIKVMTRVWEESKHKGSELLLLLAIADNARDDGHAWPGLSVLSGKTRLSRQTLSKKLENLVESGELYIHAQKGFVHHYAVLVGLSPEEKAAVIDKIEKRRGAPTEYKTGGSKDGVTVEPVNTGRRPWETRGDDSGKDGATRTVINRKEPLEPKGCAVAQPPSTNEKKSPPSKKGRGISVVDPRGIPINKKHPRWNELWDAIVDVTGVDVGIRTNRTNLGRVVKEILQSEVEYTGEDIQAAPKWWKAENFPGRVTVNALPKWLQDIRAYRLKSTSNAPKPYVPKHVDVYVPPADVVNPVRQKETAA